MTVKQAKRERAGSDIDFWVSPTGCVRDHSPWLAPPACGNPDDTAPAAPSLPDGTSSHILTAPARGPVDRFVDAHTVPVGTDKFERVEERYGKGAPVRCRDIFDEMNEQAMRRRKGRLIFTAAQADAGRRYRDLVERCATAGLKISSTFSDHAGGSGKVDFIDAYMADLQRLAWFHRAIGDATAKDVRRKQPARAGKVVISDIDLIETGRRIITVRQLVDDVCLRERSLSEVLSAHGWAWGENNAKHLRSALCQALDRMRNL